MDKIRKYVERFFKSRECNSHCVMNANEIIDVMNKILSSEDANSLLPIICMLFKYGYAKGYRAAMAEMKKGGAAS